MRLVKRATAILLATTMLGANAPQLANAHVSHAMGAYDFTLNVGESYEESLPKVAPENLYAGEYFMLAEHYISYWNYKEAAKCIAKVKKLAPGSLLERDALQLEKYHLFTDGQFKQWVEVEKLKGDPEEGDKTEYLKEIRRFLIVYPNCQYAMEQLFRYSANNDEREKVRKRLSEYDPGGYACPDYFDSGKESFTNFIARTISDVRNLLAGGYAGNRIRQKNKSGFIDRNANFVFHLEDPINANEDFSEGFSLARTHVFTDKKGGMLTLPECTRALHFSEGLAPIKINDYWGFINTKGQIAIKPDLQFALWFKEGLAPVKIDGKWGYINKANKLVIKPQFTEALNFQDGLAAVSIKNKTGFINKSGKIVIPAQYDVAESFSNGLAKVVNFETPINRLHVYYIDTKGIRVFDLNALQHKFDKYGQHFEHTSQLTLHSGIDVLIGAFGDSNPDVWNLNYDRQFQALNQFHDDRLLVHLGDMFGFVDTKGLLVIPANYSVARSFSEGLAAVGFNNTYGFIDKNANLVIPMKYSEVGDFHEGLAYVKITDGIGGFIDTTGKLVIQFEGKSTRFKEGLAPVEWQDPLYYNR